MSTPANIRAALTCKKCERLFNDPVCLPNCYHKFCRGCINDSDTTGPVQSNCPECGEQFLLDPNTPLISDPTLKTLLAAFDPPKQGRVGKVCSADHVRDLFCMVEKMEICNDCFTNTHDGHEVRPLRRHKFDMATQFVDEISKMENDLGSKKLELEALKNTLQDYVKDTEATIEMGKLAEHAKIKDWIADEEMTPLEAIDEFFVFVQEYQRLMNIKVEVTEGDMSDSMIRFKLQNVSKLDHSKHYHSKHVLVKGVKWRITVKLDPLETSILRKRVLDSRKLKDELLLGIYLNATLHNFRPGEKYSVEHEMRLVRQTANQEGDEVRTHVNEFPASNGALISGWPDFVSYSDLCDHKNGWLKNDTAEITCELKVTKIVQGTKQDKKEDSDDSDDNTMNPVMNALLSSILKK